MATQKKTAESKTRRVVPTIPEHHDWLKDIKRVSLIFEYLLDEYFGCEFSADPDENERIRQANIQKGEKIVALMLKRRKEEQREVKKLVRSQTLRALATKGTVTNDGECESGEGTHQEDDE